MMYLVAVVFYAAIAWAAFTAIERKRMDHIVYLALYNIGSGSAQKIHCFLGGGRIDLICASLDRLRRAGVACVVLDLDGDKVYYLDPRVPPPTACGW